MAMDATRIDVDTGVFSPDVIARAAHRYTGEFYVELVLSAPPSHVVLTPKHAGVDTANLALRFGNDLLDEQLRARIRTETSDLQTVLVEAALREAFLSESKVAP